MTKKILLVILVVATASLPLLFSWLAHSDAPERMRKWKTKIVRAYVPGARMPYEKE